MSKLNELWDMDEKYLGDNYNQQIKELFLELVGDVEQRETTDMSLKSWTSDDYKAFGRNELRIELRQKVEEL